MNGDVVIAKQRRWARRERICTSGPQGLKPASHRDGGGRAEAVPFPLSCAKNASRKNAREMGHPGDQDRSGIHFSDSLTDFNRSLARNTSVLRRLVQVPVPVSPSQSLVKDIYLPSLEMFGLWYPWAAH